MEDSRSKSVAIRQLARELLDDMELGRINIEQTVLKALRLARLSDATEQQSWLVLELTGYEVDNEFSMKYLGWTGRWTDQARRQAFREPLAQLEARLRSWELQLQTLRIPDVNASISLSSSNPQEYVGGTALARREFPDPSKPINAVINQSNQLAQYISRVSGIRTKTIAMIYNFALNTHLQREFSSLTESIFDQYKLEVDRLIATTSGDVLQKLPSVWMRLGEGDAEAITHALTTCRRILDAFANSMIPESTLTEEELKANNLTKGRTARYRIRKYISQQSQSDSQRDRLGRSLTDIYSKLSGGVHDEVSVAEARALFLGTYLLLGEVLALPGTPSPPAAESVGPTPQTPEPPTTETVSQTSSDQDASGGGASGEQGRLDPPDADRPGSGRHDAEMRVPDHDIEGRDS